MKRYFTLHKDGKQRPEHRIIMEQILGRKLKSTEIIHHIDGDGLNNHPDNLVITNRKQHCLMHYNEDRKKQFQSMQHLGRESLKKIQISRPNPIFKGQRWNHHKSRRGFIVRKCPDCSLLFWQRHDNRHMIGLCKLCNGRRANKFRWSQAPISL